MQQTLAHTGGYARLIKHTLLNFRRNLKRDVNSEINLAAEVQTAVQVSHKPEW